MKMVTKYIYVPELKDIYQFVKKNKNSIVVENDECSVKLSYRTPINDLIKENYFIFLR